MIIDRDGCKNKCKLVLTNTNLHLFLQPSLSIITVDTSSYPSFCTCEAMLTQDKRDEERVYVIEICGTVHVCGHAQRVECALDQIMVWHQCSQPRKMVNWYG